jgi:hypothetical protein
LPFVILVTVVIKPFMLLPSRPLRSPHRER